MLNTNTHTHKTTNPNRHKQTCMPIIAAPIHEKNAPPKVGTLVALRVNVSFNQISDLVDVPSANGAGRSERAEQGTLSLFCVVQERPPEGRGGPKCSAALFCVELVLNFCMAGSVYHSNIKILDLSHNNVSHIGSGFFKPAELSLTQLYLGYNAITVGDSVW